MLQHPNHRPDFYTTSDRTSANIHVGGGLATLSLGQEEIEIIQVTF